MEADLVSFFKPEPLQSQQPLGGHGRPLVGGGLQKGGLTRRAEDVEGRSKDRAAAYASGGGMRFVYSTAGTGSRTGTDLTPPSAPAPAVEDARLGRGGVLGQRQLDAPSKARTGGYLTRIKK